MCASMPSSLYSVQERCISKSCYYYDRLPDGRQLRGGKGSVLAHSLRGVVSRGEGVATAESVAVGGWMKMDVSCSHLGGSESRGIHFFYYSPTFSRFHHLYK